MSKIKYKNRLKEMLFIGALLSIIGVALLLFAIFYHMNVVAFIVSTLSIIIGLVFFAFGYKKSISSRGA